VYRALLLFDKERGPFVMFERPEHYALMSAARKWEVERIERWGKITSAVAAVASVLVSVAISFDQANWMLLIQLLAGVAVGFALSSSWMLPVYRRRTMKVLEQTESYVQHMVQQAARDT
jgi:hypothetical protein